MFCFSCTNTNKENNKKTLESFFSKTNWEDFNSKTLSENELNHFINDKIDFFNRESFFSYIKKNKIDLPYDDFYLIEIENPNGERADAKKIIVINHDNKLTYLGFKKLINWSKIDLSSNEINEYKFEKLKSGTQNNSNSYILTTHITSDTY